METSTRAGSHIEAPSCTLDCGPTSEPERSQHWSMVASDTVVNDECTPPAVEFVTPDWVVADSLQRQGEDGYAMSSRMSDMPEFRLPPAPHLGFARARTNTIQRQEAAVKQEALLSAPVMENVVDDKPHADFVFSDDLRAALKEHLRNMGSQGEGVSSVGIRRLTDKIYKECEAHAELCKKIVRTSMKKDLEQCQHELSPRDRGLRRSRREAKVSRVKSDVLCKALKEAIRLLVCEQVGLSPPRSWESKSQDSYLTG